jgi:hypothetical protein
MILSRCTVCRHKERENIDAALSASEPQNEICARFSVAPGPLSRHNQRHRLEQEFDVAKSRPARGSLMAKLFEEARQEISVAKKSGDPIALNRANKRMNYAQALHRESMVAQRRAFEQGLAQRVKKESFGQHGRAQPVSPLKEIVFRHVYEQTESKNMPQCGTRAHLAMEIEFQFIPEELVGAGAAEFTVEQIAGIVVKFSKLKKVPTSLVVSAYHLWGFAKTGKLPDADFFGRICDAVDKLVEEGDGASGEGERSGAGQAVRLLGAGTEADIEVGSR